MSFGNKTGGSGFGSGGGGFGNKTGGGGFGGGGGGTSGTGSGGFGNKTGGSGFGNNNNQSGNNNNNQGGGDQNGGNNNNNNGQGSGNNQGSGSGSGGGGFGNKSGFGSGGGSGSGGGFGGGSGGGFGNKTGSSTQQQPMLVSAVTKGVLGPGFVPPNTAHWAQDIDLTQLRDDAVFEDLPASLQTHLKTIDAFMTLEQQAADEIRKVYAQLLDPQYPKGYHALREKIDRLTEGPTSLNAVRFQVNSLEAAVKTTIANTQAVQKHVVEYSKHVWDPVHNKGHDFWSHRQNASEGPSQFFDDTVTRLMQNIDQLETMLEELELALVPRSSTGGGSGAQGGAVQLAGGLGVGGGMLASGAAGVVANNNAGMRGTLATLSGVAMDGAQPALSTTQLVALTMQNELQLFLDLASRAAEHHSVADQVREEYRRQFGDHEAREFFDRLRRERAEADDLRQEGVKKMGFDPSREVAKATGGAGASSSTSGSSGAGGGAAAGGGGGDDKPKTGFGGGGFGGAGGFGAKKDGDAAAKPAGAGFGFASTPAPKAGGNDTTANTPAQPEFPTPSALNQTDNRSGFGSPSPQPSKPAGGGFGKSAAPGGAGAGKFGFGAPKASDNNADNGEQPTKRGRD